MKLSSLFGADGPEVERIHYDSRSRTLHVARVERVAPGMLRITFDGDDLADFESRGFDDHIKIMVPAAPERIERRDYTPRRFDLRTRTLVLDFALHEAGPASHGRVAQSLAIGWRLLAPRAPASSRQRSGGGC